MKEKGPWQKADYADIQRLKVLLKYLPATASRESASTFLPAKDQGDVIVIGEEILSEYAQNFLTDAYDYGWVQDFDWSGWSQSQDGRSLLEDQEAMASATVEDLAKVITSILRRDRFVGGTLAASFNSGLIGRIAQRAEILLESRSQVAAVDNIARPWPCEYYDAMHHYFYAPDRLEHQSIKENSKGRHKRVMEKLAHIEEPLNHIMGFFFALASRSFIHKVFAQNCDVQATGPVRLLGRSVEKELGLGNFTQPDFTFDGDECFLTLEAKIDHHSSLEQLVKYAALHCIAEDKKPGRQHALLYVSKEPRQKLFKEKVIEWPEIRNRAKQHLRDHPPKSIQKLEIKETSIMRMLDNLKLGHMTFSQLAEALDSQTKLARASGNEEGELLYAGLSAEFKSRDLS